MGEIVDFLLFGLDFLRVYNCIINLENFILIVDKVLIFIIKIKIEGLKNDVEIYRVLL